MRIAISAVLSDQGKSGIGQYTRNLLAALQSIDKENEYYIFSCSDQEGDLDLSQNNFIKIYSSSRIKSPLINIAWHQTFFLKQLISKKINLVHIPSPQRLPLFKVCPVVVTVHDLAPFYIERKYDPLRMFYNKRIVPFLIKRADAIITVSKSTKQDLIKVINVPPEKIYVIPLGINHSRFYPRDKNECYRRVRNKYGLPEKYLLYVARLEHPGKNHVRLIEAFSELKGKYRIPHKLVLSGAKWTRHEQIFDAVRRFDLKGHVIFTGFVPGEDLLYIYGAADLFVYPSLFEGFGIPPLEAMACGVPVICSNVSSLPEVAGEAALLVDPYNVNELVKAIYTCLTDEALRREMIKRGLKRAKLFNWNDTARKTLEIYKKTLQM